MTLNHVKSSYNQVFKLYEIEYKEISANTNLWIPTSHYICLTFNNLVHIIIDGTRRFPLLYSY